MQQYAGLIMSIAFIGIFYFLLIRPQQKRDKELKEMRANLKVGDEVVTIGGLVGKIFNVTEDMVTVEVGGDKTRLHVEKWAIGKMKNK
ncbi:preprotein translocase subunit YajC [Tepidibacter formicigenes]|uniref:Preprotein translocase subunit YajC n=1 Tax=Tepidibacter formicigenes DSM 15518 TaxID=1123349 RepID=A0A1M6MWF4_9FIRM|nr:preprotein translocase subunit YajC [Tepidibacter formicigenes]SHJ87720.1 preprotein translocase subunit YajC [Tepidibacter formicigenes DSM 15518]